MNVITRQGYHFEDLELGMEASFAKAVSAADVLSFAEVTGDRTDAGEGSQEPLVRRL